MPRTCPDCGVELEHVEHHAGADIPREGISIEAPDAGLRSIIPGAGNKYLDAYLCPECGLVRFYADV